MSALMIQTSLSRTRSGGLRDHLPERSTSPTRASAPFLLETPPKEVQTGRDEHQREKHQAEALGQASQPFVVSSGEVPQKRGACTPQDSGGDAPWQEPPVRHARDPGRRGNDRAQKGGEPAQKDGLCSALAEPLPTSCPFFPASPREQSPAVSPSDEIPDRVAGDRPEDSRRQDSRERHPGPRR